MKRIYQKENGFTLLEMLLVILIIGVLASIVAPKMSTAIDEARTTADIAQGRLIKQSIDLYYIKHGKNPQSISSLQEFLGTLTSAQKLNGQSIVLDDNSFGRPVFDINLATKNVKVKDLQSDQVIWSSE